LQRGPCPDCACASAALLRGLLVSDLLFSCSHTSTNGSPSWLH
jgi:hypothetical protein